MARQPAGGARRLKRFAAGTGALFWRGETKGSAASFDELKRSGERVLDTTARTAPRATHYSPIDAADRARQREQGVPSNQATLLDLDAAREETWRLLQSAAHYCRCAQLHLEAADDAVTLYDMRAARDYFIAAIREFEPLRRSLSERVGATEAAA